MAKPLWPSASCRSQDFSTELWLFLFLRPRLSIGSEFAQVDRPLLQKDLPKLGLKQKKTSGCAVLHTRDNRNRPRK